MEKLLNDVVFPDAKGFLLNTLNKEKVQKKWLEAANDFVNYFVTYEDTNINSVYLRGSAANGTAIDFFSDIDFYLLTERPLSHFDIEKIKEYTDQLNKKYPFITRFDVGYYIKDQILTQKEGFLLKITALCIYGEDVSELIAAPKPGADMALSISQLEHDIHKIKSEAIAGFYDDPEKVKDLSGWILKKIIRSGFDLVAYKEQCFTRKLVLCNIIFSKHYPYQAAAMQEVLELFLHKTHDITHILSILDGIGMWLVHENKNHPVVNLGDQLEQRRNQALL